MIAVGARVSLYDGGQVPLETLEPGMELIDPFRDRPLVVETILSRKIGTLGNTTRERMRLSPVLLRSDEPKDQRSTKDLMVSPQQPLLMRSRQRSVPPSYGLVTARALVSLGEAERVSVAEDFTYCLVITLSSGLMVVEGKILKAMGAKDVFGAGRLAGAVSIEDEQKAAVIGRKGKDHE